MIFKHVSEPRYKQHCVSSCLRSVYTPTFLDAGTASEGMLVKLKTEAAKESDRWLGYGWEGGGLCALYLFSFVLCWGYCLLKS